MEPLDSVYLTSKTDIINVGDVECRTPSPVTSCAGSDCSISTAKAVATAEAAIEERNDVMLRLMGHLIPVSTGPEEDSASETDTSVVSSATTLKRRLHNLPAPSEAVKLADRVAVLNRRIRRERDLYLHLQGVSNRIEEKDEGDLSTTDSSKTINPKSNRHQGQISNARARRRERLNSGLAISQHKISSDLQLCSPGLSSPEPLTLREIREDLTEGMDQLSPPIKTQCYFENDVMMNRVQENIVTGLSNSTITQELEMVDDMISSCQNASRFSNESYSGRNICPVVVSDCENLTAMADAPPDGHVGISDFHFDDANHFKDGLTNCNLSSEAENPCVQATTSSTGVDYPYVTRKRTPMKFGGYRPSSGLIFRNLSSDSESDAISDQIVRKGLRSQKYRRGNWTELETHDAEEQELRGYDFVSKNLSPNTDRIMKVEPFSVEKIEVLEDRLLTPVLSVDSKHLFEESNPNQRSVTSSDVQIPGETRRAPIPSNGRNQNLDNDIEDMVEQNTSVNCNAGNLHNAQFMEENFVDSLSGKKNARISRNLNYDTSTEDSLTPVHHVSFTKKNHTEILASLRSSRPVSDSLRDTETSNLREGCSSSRGSGGVNFYVAESSAKVPGITNHQSVSSSSKSRPENIRNFENLEYRARNHDYEFVTITRSADMESDDDLIDENVHPKIPPLAIECSSHSLSSEEKGDETARSSLDVNALIQALSDVSLKQKNSSNCTNRSIAKLKSPLEYGNRFSGSSGPRSSEYTPAPGGSRQSLTSLEVSEAHSMKIYKGELTARRQATPLLKSDEQSARSASRTGKVSEFALSTPPPDMKKSPMIRSKDPRSEDDLSRGSRVIPVVAKVDKSNILCSKNPLRNKSIAKLISPRKYPNSDFRGEIVNQLTSRTDVSQSSERSRKSFRSLKSVQHGTKVNGKKIDGSQMETNSIGISGPLSGRRVLEPLNLVPKIQPELLTGMNRKFKRCEKTANDLSEIINSQSEAGSKRTTTANSSRNSSRKSPPSRTKRTDLPVPRFAQSLQNSKRLTPGEPSTERDHKYVGNSIKSKKKSSVSSRKSSVTSDNVSFLHLERLSLSSGDYEGKMSFSPSPRDEDLTENDNTYGSENELYDRQQQFSAVGEEMSEAMDQDEQSIRLSNLTSNSLARSSRNCVHVNDLQDEREVSLTCGNARRPEDSLKETELFNRLPNEIIGSLTRRASLGTKVTEDSHSTQETLGTIESLRRNIQENNDQWIKNFRSSDDSGITRLGSAEDKVSSTGSSVQYRKSESRNLLLIRTKIPQKIPLGGHDNSHAQLSLEKATGSTDPSYHRNCVPGKIDPGRFDSECSSPLRGNITQEFEYTSEPCQLDSRRSSLIHSGANSHQGTSRSIAESINDDHEASRQDFAIRMTERNADESCNVEDEKTVNCERQISNITKELIVQIDSPEVQFAVNPSETEVETDQHDRNVLSFNTDAKSSREDDVQAVKTMPFENLAYSDKDCRESEKKITACGCEQGIQLVDELKDHESSRYPAECKDNGFGTCEKICSPSSTRSAMSQTVTQHDQDGMISSSLSIKNSLSMSKLNSSVDSKWDMTVTTGANSVKKSQDRFPFTMSESASRKTSKFKVAADVNLDQLLQDQNAHIKLNNSILTRNPVLAKSGDRRIPTTDTVDADKRVDNCEQSTTRQLTPFLEELTSEISHDSPYNWDAQIPFMGSNYMSYGCREETRTLMPTVKEMVKKLSAKLRYAKTKRCQDPEETQIEILYRNKKCRYESGEGSSSAASLYESQFLNTSNKLVPSLVRRSNDGSRTSSGNGIKPRMNHECISMSIDHSPRKGCDQNDLWIQEFDSDAEFDTLPVSEVAYCQRQNDHSIPKTNSPASDRYSMFLARRKLSEIMNEDDHHERKMGSVRKYCEGGDSENVHCKSPRDADGQFNEVPEMVLKSPGTPANSTNDNTNEFQIDPTVGDNPDNSIANSGCCCLRIYHFFVGSKKHSSKTRRRSKVWKKK